MRILFQGDSVTDAGRDRQNPRDMGEGYPRYASAMLQDAYPDTDFEFINLGISGNRTEDLLGRLEPDFLDVQPDILSLMIGINDVWHRVAVGIETTDEAFENNLRCLLSSVKERTNAKILLIQPFLLFGGEEQGLAEELARKQMIYRRLADEYADAYLAIHDILKEQTGEDPAAYAEDGIHPTSDGAALIGEAYLEAIAPLIEAVMAKEDA